MEGKDIPCSRGLEHLTSPDQSSSIQPYQGNPTDEEVRQLSFLNRGQFGVQDYPQPLLSSHPFLQEIQPLTSSGIFSPLPDQPLVILPNHHPISPISRVIPEFEEPLSPDSVFRSPELPNSNNYQGHRLVNEHLHRSNIRHWAANLSPEQEWDSFNQAPTFERQQEFWDSRGLAPILENTSFTVDRI